ncbi:MAG: small basic protein [Planctomycetaceae bacterium]
MSIDKSLKKPSGMVRSRNVLKRGERILQLMSEDRWSDGRSPLGLPKVRIRQVVTGKKKKKSKDDGDDAGK